ncbi:MAG: hypothetical protein GY705_21535 [Bacteroidetes bacterium]|nr:hypothetical protein [Bacteroidota bacterium]
MHVNKRRILLIVFGLLLSLVYLYYFENRASVEIDISVSQRSWFKVYWAEEGEEFSEKNRARIRVNPNKSKYRFFLTNVGNINRLRIDPHDYKGRSALKSIIISQNHFHPLSFDSEKSFTRLSPVFHIAEFDYSTTEGLITVSDGRDPAYSVFITPEHQRSVSYYFYMIARIAGIVLLLVILLTRADAFLDRTEFVPVLITTIFFLIVAMASLSQPEVHPDEYVHFDAAEYYVNNWLPPEVDSPEISHTFSIYGVSRLNSREISYFFAGKFAKLIAPFQIPDYLRYRMFNVFLFGMVLATVYYNREARLVAFPFLLSPQIWYIFSYCNSDAFALAVTFFICCQLLKTRSIFASYLSGDSDRKIMSLFFLGLLGGMLLLLKKNYYFFLVFAAGYFLWHLFFWVEAEKRIMYLKRLSTIALVAILFAGGRFGIDYYINGAERSEKIAALRIEYAEPLYNPNTPIEDKHVFLYRKERGDDWRKLVFHERWLEKTYRSAVGLYGYLNVVAPDSYYDAYGWLGGMTLLMLIVFVILRGGPAHWILMLFFLICSLGMIFISFWHSWTADFQTQGRYLLPIVPMLSILVYGVYRFIPRPLMHICVLVLFLISSYSFIYVGLWQIPKVAGL